MEDEQGRPRKEVIMKSENGNYLGMKKFYEFNRVNRNISVDSKKSMITKMARGIWSISSRKVQPHVDLDEIFDPE